MKHIPHVMYDKLLALKKRLPHFKVRMWNVGSTKRNRNLQSMVAIHLSGNGYSGGDGVHATGETSRGSSLR